MSSSGWDDGKIRAFTPETGRLLYEIDNAHQIGVTALATTNDMKHIISGGGEGEVRVWTVSGCNWRLKGAMKEKHKGNDINKQQQQQQRQQQQKQHFLVSFSEEGLAPQTSELKYTNTWLL